MTLPVITSVPQAGLLRLGAALLLAARALAAGLRPGGGGLAAV